MAPTFHRMQPLQAALLSGLVLLGAGCAKHPAGNQSGQNSGQNSAVQTQPAPPNDAAISNDVQSRLAAESALAGQNIQASVQNGVVTLSGSANNDAARALAGNDAGAAAGVRTVVNNLTVAPVVAAQPPAPRPAPTVRRKVSHQRPAQSRRAQVDTTPPVEAPPPAQAYQEPVRTVAPPPPPAPPVVKRVTIPSGATLPIRMTDALETGQAQQGQLFHGTIANDVLSGDLVALPRGTPVTGRVIDAKDAAHFAGSAMLSIELTNVDVNGRPVSVVTAPYVQQGKGRGKNTAMKTGGGAAIGAIIGALAGGGKGAAIGAASGGGLGAGVNGVTRGEQVKIPAETLINFQLQSPVSVTAGEAGQNPKSYNENDNPQLQQR
ncbi:MAG: BON domain-containing protein [Acidobacteriaceae bacterium]